MNDELLNLIRHDGVGDVQETLQFLLEECSIDEAPQREEVVQWRDILAQRGSKFARLAAMCQQFLDETA